MSDTRIGAGSVRVQFNGSEHVLRPSLHAIKTLSRASGGLRGAMVSVLGLDFDVITNVVRVGLGPEAVKELGGAEKVEQLVYEAGMTDTTGQLVEKCNEFLMNLSRGGRPEVPRAEEGASDNP